MDKFVLQECKVCKGNYESLVNKPREFNPIKKFMILEGCNNRILCSECRNFGVINDKLYAE